MLLLMHSAVVADGSGCTNPHADQIGSLCTLVQEHTGGGSGLAVAVVSRLLWPLAVLAVVIVAMRLLRNLAERAVARSAADQQIRTLVHNVLVGGGVIVAISAALYSAGLDLGIFLTIGGLSTLAIGLAFQDLLRNVLAGILLLVERPFVIGDDVTIDTLTGKVQTIELRTTALRLADGRLAIVPNLEAFTKTVINLSAFEQRQWTVSSWVPSGTDLEKAIRAARQVLAETREASAEPAPRVQPSVELDGGVTLQLQYWLDYRSNDADAVAASVVRRLQAALSGASVPDELVPAEPPPAEEDEPDPPAPRAGRRRRPRLLHPLDHSDD